MAAADYQERMTSATAELLAEMGIIVESHITYAYTRHREIAADHEVELERFDERRIGAQVSQAVGLITRHSVTALDRVLEIVSRHYRQGTSPDDLRKELNKAFGRHTTNWKVVAWDQIAKAQEAGRDASYADDKVEQVEVMVAPDACEKCQPHNGKVVAVVDREARPQFHIQCCCMDIPATTAD